MFFKLLTAIFVILAAAGMLAGRRVMVPTRNGGRAPARVPLADDFERCARCGVWLPAARPCGCAGRA